MIIVLKSGISDADVSDVCRRITEMGYGPHVIRGEFKTIVAAVGEERGRPDLRLLEALETVESVMPVQQPFKLASREVRRESSEVRINGVTVGGRDVVVMAGPCSVESEAQVLEVAEAVKASGARILRGGAYKPRTSPYAFQGLKEQGLRYLAEARKRTGLPVVTEVLETESVEVVAEYSDILQIGARNIQNFSLLRRVGRDRQAGPAQARHGDHDPGVPALGRVHPRGGQSQRDPLRARHPHLRARHAVHARPERGAGAQEALATCRSWSIPRTAPGTGTWWRPMAKASVACGADGLIIEVHPRPEEALSDGPQSLKPSKFAQLMRELRPVAEAVGAGDAPQLEPAGAALERTDDQTAFAAAVRSSVSRTRWTRAAGVNGFCRKAVPAASTPWRTTASSV